MLIAAARAMALTPVIKPRLWDRVPPKTVRMNATPTNTQRAGDPANGNLVHSPAS
jgi:hypothetical protein